MKKIFLSFFSLLFCVGFAKAQTLDWAFLLESTSTTMGYTVAVDSLGNCYAGGGFSGMTDFDPGPGFDTISNVGSFDGYIAKYDSSGNLIWVKTYPFWSSDDRVKVLKMKNGFLYAIIESGWQGFWGQVEKINPFNGGTVWQHGFSQGNHFPFENVRCSDIAIDNLDEVYVMGDFYGSINLNPGTLYSTGGFNNGNDDVFVAKLDNVGNLIWVKQFGNGGDDEGNSISAGASGNIYCTGTFEDTVDFDPGPLVYNLGGWANPTREFLLKLDSAGNFINVKGTTFSGLGFSKMTTNNNEEILAVDWGGIIKMDSSLNMIWKKNFVNASATNIECDNNGNVYSIGSYTNSNDLDPGASVYSLPSFYGDLFISALNQNGIFLMAAPLITSGSLGALNDIDTDNKGGIFSTGELNDTADFDPSFSVFNLTSFHSAYVWKLNKCSVNGPLISLSGCDSLVINGQTFFNSGNYFQSFRDSTGCDSTITLQLTINKSDNVSYNIQACDSFQFNGTSYFASGNYDFFYTNSSGCDSIEHLNLTINNSSVTNISATECTQYIFGNNILTTSGIYQDTLITSASCDSIVILSLTINGPDTSVIQNGATLTANTSGLNYVWLYCDSNYQFIPGATNQSFTPTANGSYALLIFNSFCMDTSSCYSITNVGFPENNFDNYFSVYPNPFKDEIKIVRKNPANSNFEIELYNLLGQIMNVEFDEIDSEKTEINFSTSEIPPGIYQLKCTSKSGTLIRKIVKM